MEKAEVSQCDGEMEGVEALGCSDVLEVSSLKQLLKNAKLAKYWRKKKAVLAALSQVMDANSSSALSN